MRPPAPRSVPVLCGLLALALALPPGLLAGLGSGAAKGLGKALGKDVARTAGTLLTKPATKGAERAAATLAAKAAGRSAGKAAGKVAKPAGKLAKATRATARPLGTGTRTAGHGTSSILGQGDGAFDADALRAALSARGIEGEAAERIVRRQAGKAARARAAQTVPERLAANQALHAGTNARQGALPGLDAGRFASRDEWVRHVRPDGHGPIHAPDRLVGFPGTRTTQRMTPVQGGGGMRKRWKNSGGEIFEWDSLHGNVERYSKSGRHLGEFDAWTGRMIKGPSHPPVEP